MPLILPEALPARHILEAEGIFCAEKNMFSQACPRISVGILNLMPTKEATEAQLLRLLSASALPVEVTFLKMGSHVTKNASAEHMSRFYVTLEQALSSGKHFDGMVITGAPVEKLDYPQVDYWNELKEFIFWSNLHARSTFYICWAALAGLFVNHGIEKVVLSNKIVGLFPHETFIKSSPLTISFDDRFIAPHSRFGTVREEDLLAAPGFDILAGSDRAGSLLIATKECRQVYVTGHMEYDLDTLKNEYIRDLKKGINDTFPIDYFPDNDPDNPPRLIWRSHASLLWRNWLDRVIAPSVVKK
ncbi:MAG: homoserine O-succinyltransferase [Clostridiales bacterium]|nr:homoserine O-succinyltransferase [Clostridiales bacterium]